MSAAYKCDGCGALLEQAPPLAVGDVLLTHGNGKTQAREILDFCRDCAPRVLAALALPALDSEEGGA